MTAERTEFLVWVDDNGSVRLHSSWDKLSDAMDTMADLEANPLTKSLVTTIQEWVTNVRVQPRLR